MTLAIAGASLGWLVFAIALSGIYIAIEETLEKAVVAELLPRDLQAGSVQPELHGERLLLQLRDRRRGLGGVGFGSRAPRMFVLPHAVARDASTYTMDTTPSAAKTP